MLCSHVCSHHVHRLVATPTNAQQAKTSALGVHLTARDRAKRLGGSRAMPHGASATSVAMCMCQCTRDARKYDKTRKLSIKRVVSTILSSLFNSPEQLIDYRIFFRFEGGYLQLIEELLMCWLHTQIICVCNQHIGLVRTRRFPTLLGSFRCVS